MYASSNNFQIDRNQIAQQLELLGYKPGEKVFLRAFYPSDDPRKTGDKGRKGDATTVELVAQAAEMFHDGGRGVYFVVNGSGQKDAEVKACRAIFYEHDNLSKEIQLELWRTLGLPEPTFQVDTGGKSIHSYWVFDEPIDPTRWRILQADLLEFASADRSLKNPSRVMRLAGCYHISAKGAYKSVIVTASGTRYSYSQLRAIVQAKRKAPFSPLPLPTQYDVPLIKCLSLSDRELIAGGVSQGERNSKGAKLSRDLIGTAFRLQYLGVRYSGSPRQLFDDYCLRCTPPLHMKEADNIWKSASRDNPTATLSDDALLNCVKSWQKQQVQKTQNGFSSSANNLNTQSNINVNIVELSLRDRIAEILDRGLISSLEKEALLELAKQTKTSPREIEVLAGLVRHEVEREQDREQTQKEVAELIQPRVALNLADYLPKGLAEPLMQWCRWLNIRPEVALTAILATTSSLHETGTELIIHRAQGFRVPSTLFMAFVSESGQKKSPVFKNLITAPLKQLKAEAKAEYESALNQHDIDLAAWEKKKTSCSKPKKPGLKTYHINSSTGEGIQAQAQSCPHKPLFMLVDELKGMFDSANQYRSGRGSDRQDILSYYEGTGQTTLRASGVTVDVDEIYISIYGGIQPEVLKTHTKDLRDADGYWARFLFVNQPLAAGELGDDIPGFDIAELIRGYYCHVHTLGKRSYTLSREAFKVYQPVYNELERRRVSHPSPGMRAIYAKLEGQIGRLALNLHAIEQADEISRNGSRSGSLTDEISASTMRKAIALANFYLEEVTDLHADSKADKGDLPALLAKLLEYASTKGSLTPRDAVTKFNAIKTSPQALDHFRELEAMGYGAVEKQKRNWVFIPTQDSRNGSRNSRNGSRNGSRNDFFPEESLASEHSESSRNSRNERNDFLDFSPTTKDGQPSDIDEYKIPPEIITPLQSLREIAQTNVESEVQPRNDSRNADKTDHYANDTIVGSAELIRQALKDLSSETISDITKDWSAEFKAQIWAQLSLYERKSAKAIKSAESFTVLQEPVSLLQVEINGGDIGAFVGCQVEARELSGDIKFAGEMTDWDEKHGNITVATALGARIAHVRESFLISPKLT